MAVEEVWVRCMNMSLTKLPVDADTCSPDSALGAGNSPDYPLIKTLLTAQIQKFTLKDVVYPACPDDKVV